MSEFCHNITPHPQPSPAKNPGGDCFACTLFAGLRFLFPDNHPTFDECWEAFKVKTVSDALSLSNSWYGFQSALRYFQVEKGLKLEVEKDIFETKKDLQWFSYSYGLNALDDRLWLYRLEGWLRMGFVAACEISFNRRPPINDQGKFNFNDHFVLIDGTRHRWARNKNVDFKAWSLEIQVHIVCSAKGLYWIDVEEFVNMYGASAWILFRKESHGEII